MTKTVIGIDGAWLGLSPKKGTKYVNLLCILNDGQKMYHRLYLTEKTTERSIKTLVAYGFKKTLEDIGLLADGSLANEFFDIPNNGIEVTVKTESWTDKATGQQKEITKIDYVNSLKPEGPAPIDKSELHKFGPADAALRAQRGALNLKPAQEADIPQDWEEGEGDDGVF